ncbi:MAG: hypothetical protein ACLU84_01230 [Clostridia bacterium]
MLNEIFKLLEEKSKEEDEDFIVRLVLMYKGNFGYDLTEDSFVATVAMKLPEINIMISNVSISLKEEKIFMRISVDKS